MSMHACMYGWMSVLEWEWGVAGGGGEARVGLIMNLDGDRN